MQQSAVKCRRMHLVLKVGICFHNRDSLDTIQTVAQLVWASIYPVPCILDPVSGNVVLDTLGILCGHREYFPSAPAVYGVQCIVNIIQSKVYCVQCTVYIIQFTVNNIQCTVYSAQCTVHSVECRECGIHCGTLTAMAPCRAVSGWVHSTYPTLYITVTLFTVLYSALHYTAALYCTIPVLHYKCYTELCTVPYCTSLHLLTAHCNRVHYKCCTTL